MSAKDRGRVHQFGTKVLPAIFIGYSLNAVGSWTGDLLTVDMEDLKTMPPSEIHVKRFKSTEVDFEKRDNEFVFPCRKGDMLQE